MRCSLRTKPGRGGGGGHLCPGLNKTTIFTVFRSATNFTKIAIFRSSSNFHTILSSR